MATNPTESEGSMMSNLHEVITVDGKRWIPTIQDWSWVIIVAWMTIANIWKPFGLYGLVCMFTPILIALSGRGKMHCARICPRGSLLGKVGKHLSIGLPRPKFFGARWFRVAVWAIMMGSFAVMLIFSIPKGVYVVGNSILVFMEVATGVGLLLSILFQPRTWCTICPMGFSTGNIRKLKKHRQLQASACTSGDRQA
jgi:hypothetical protein